MIKVNIVCVGKIKEDYLRAAVAEYLKRLSRFCRTEIKEVAEGKNLKEEAAANRIEREESRKEAKKARRLTVAAFVLSIVFPIVSIVASVLIALYL